MGKILDASYFAMSRRRLMWMTALGSLGLRMGVRAAAAEPDPSEADEQLEKIGETVVSIYLEEPDLAGFGVAMTVAAAAFADRSDGETDLLTGRLYDQSLEALRQAEQDGVVTDFSWDSLHGVLSDPPEVDSLDRDYFDRLLADTKERAAADGDFSRTLAACTQAANSGAFTTVISGHHVPVKLWLVSAGIVVGELVPTPP